MKTGFIFEEKSEMKQPIGGWMLRLVLSFCVVLAVKIVSFAQNAVQFDTEKGIVNAIATYNADVRQSILVASQYPQVFADIRRLKDKEQTSFHTLISNFSQEKQGWFYELTRYPDLLHTLAIKPDGLKRDDVGNLLPNKEQTLEKAAWRLYRFHKADLVEADNLNQQADEAYNKLLGSLELPVKVAFQNLVKYPDVMSILTNNLALTTEVGKQYVADKEAYNQFLAAKHDSLVIQNDREVAYYKKQLDENPQAKAELTQAAKDYAQENGYIVPNTSNYYNQNYYVNPYSFWFGYPYWYGSPLWYPSAYWGGFGFNYGLGGLGFYGFPTFGFTNWFFNGGYYYRYPTLYRHLGNYYRNTIVNNRVVVPATRGFMNAAREHYSPNTSARTNYSRGFNSDFRNSTSSGRVFNGAATGSFNRGGFSGGGFNSGRMGGGFSGGRGGRH